MVRAGLTTERVVRAAADLADQGGFETLTVSELARHFGVKVPSLYAHVRGSQDLRTRVALLAFEELADRAAEAVAGRAGKDALVALANVYRDYAREHPGRYDATRLRLDHETAAASAAPRHSQLLRAVLRGYDLSGEEQTHAVRLLGAAIHGYVSLEQAGGFEHSAPDTQRSWSRALDALDALLRHWPV
ncbi:TetR/AcrR family transcriptional regulator [Symbioplanes lichenis]|uniref:TetR/AcrR family transcriptional regulator n=1 Tax=Symbioplanes lichenis TaxID=1629072 RepID=UPI002738A320|nr:TetR/AcrR family transcriptional regulator [Actinoplanes lichenis]